MTDIYRRAGYVEPSEVLDEMNMIQDEIDEEQMKDDSEYDRDKVFNLMYKQFVTGLRLNTGIRLY